MQYLELTQHTNINHITSLKRLEEEKYVRLDKFTIRSLELLQPMQEDGKSLLGVIDRTITPMGGRMLRRWVVFPLKDVKQINDRLDAVEYFFKAPDFRQVIDEQLHRVGDLERIISKVAVGRVTPVRSYSSRRHCKPSSLSSRHVSMPTTTVSNASVSR